MTTTYLPVDYVKEQVIQHYGLHGTYHSLPGEYDQNFRLRTADGVDCLVKVAHPDASLEQLEFQNALMAHVAAKNPDLLLSDVLSNLEGYDLTILPDAFGRPRYLRVLTWLPGRLWSDVGYHPPELLESLGYACGSLCRALTGFDHPGAHRSLKWDLGKASWIAAHRSLFQGEQREMIEYFLSRYQSVVEPRFPSLRQSVIHNDANDNNILVCEDLEYPEVTGLLDLGDSLFTHTVNDLAIAVTYAIMDKPDPLTAATSVVQGFDRAYPLQEAELEVLYDLTGMRLCVSMTVGAINRLEFPENEYLQVSQSSAWSLLQKWRELSPCFAHYAFRDACGMEPCPGRMAFGQWVKKAAPFAPVIGADLQNTPYRQLDLSVGSLDLGHNRNFEDTDLFDRTISRLLEEAGVATGIGGYQEVRPVYTTDHYLVKGNNGPQWRTVHLGLDIWMAAGTPVAAPLDGEVHSFADNAGDRNYGPTIILKHAPSGGPVFYTLYGHLSLDSLAGLTEGQFIGRGERFASIGPRPENGNWPPHLHFQVMLDLLGMAGDFPGVGFPHHRRIWKSLCPDPGVLQGIDLKEKIHTALPAEAILLQRRDHLGPNLSISYRRPLHIVRGCRQYLYDHEGRRYLDTVNNVAHVGHQHPVVVQAAQRQIAVLNTNTRYLHEELARFAEELCATLPEELNVCFFVNSGSEANELALRLVRAYTGRQDMVVVEAGYHGNTNACVDISSYKFDGKGGKGAPPWVHKVPMPDVYRGIYRGEGPETGKKYAAHVAGAIEKVQEWGSGMAGFIGESILSCGGQIVLPEGYLKEVYRHVRRTGGLCIADEVQVGFGRVGAHFWGFELQGVVPDIVTTGKPIGNGHPLGAVVTTRAVADAFANGMEYFNTFGGNPVSCSIGRTVLRVIREENLQEQALQTGNLLLSGLRELQERHEIIGDVRGHGLFLGIELVRDRHTLEPAGREASHLVNRMRENGILMSTDGPSNNVLKIKPPMCFDEGNVEFLVEKLDEMVKTVRRYGGAK